MNELIKVTYENDRPTVFGRELHAFLEVSTRYKDWFSRICEYGFSDGADFCPFLSESTGGRPATDHRLTLEMAKEICMLQRNERGRQARRYFIRLEQAWNAPEQVMARALRLADRQIREAQRHVFALEQTVEEQRVKIQFADAVEAADTSILVGDLARLLRQNGINTGQNRLFERLRQEGYLCSRKGEQYNAPTQRSMVMVLFEVWERTVNNPDGSVRITRTTKVTGKGQIYFINRYCKKRELHSLPERESGRMKKIV